MFIFYRFRMTDLRYVHGSPAQMPDQDLAQVG